MRRLITTTLLLAACGSVPLAEVTTTLPAQSTTSGSAASVTTFPDGPRGELAAARAKWDAENLETYSYRFVDDCGECMAEPAATVAVWDGEVVAPHSRARSVDEAFDLIARAIERGDDVDVEYHPELGYPIDLWIDREARAYDGGTHLLFDDLAPGLPGSDATLTAHEQAWQRWRDAGVDSYDYRSAVICDCAYAARMWTRVVNGLITDFDMQTDDDRVQVSAITVDSIFDDLVGILAGEDAPNGYSVAGSALYHEELGYPVWIGLDMAVVDPDAVGDDPPFPPRLVITIDELTERVPDPDIDLADARARWASAGLESYTFDIVFHDIVEADVAESFTVVVEENEIVAISDPDGGYEYPPEDVLALTVEGLFEWIEQYRLEGATVDVIYDVTHGFPAVITATRPEGWSQVISLDLHR